MAGTPVLAAALGWIGSKEVWRDIGRVAGTTGVRMLVSYIQIHAVTAVSVPDLRRAAIVQWRATHVNPRR